MVREKSSLKSRIACLGMHGGFLAWGLCLIVLAEEQRDGGDRPAATAGKPPDFQIESNDPEWKRSTAWLHSQIEGLGHPNYSVRAKATRELLASGPEAIDPLAAAILSPDPEIVRRSQYILSQLIRGDEACLVALGNVARRPQHPAAGLARAIHDKEAHRRERRNDSLMKQRQQETQRLLGEARADLYKNRFAEAREKTIAAKALNTRFDLFDDRPELVQTAIEQAEARAKISQASAEPAASR